MQNPPTPVPDPPRTSSPVTAVRRPKKEGIKGYCEKCENYAKNLVRVKGKLLCRECRDQLKPA